MEESKLMMEAFIKTHGTKEEWYNDGKQTWHNALASFKYGWEACKERLLTQRAADLPSALVCSCGASGYETHKRWCHANTASR